MQLLGQAFYRRSFLTTTSSSQFTAHLYSITLSDIDRKIYNYWLEARGVGTISRAQAQGPVPLPSKVPGYFTVIDVIDLGPQFIQRLTGSQVQDAAGQDYSGKMIN
ncbi:MAG: hypothetical protein OSB19_18700 [Opitutaceae bacterium]|nr:hypothetical protein [Opitutaceae bacterium]